jgi:hypothetical protein
MLATPPQGSRRRGEALQARQGRSFHLGAYGEPRAVPGRRDGAERGPIAKLSWGPRGYLFRSCIHFH